MIKRRSAFCVTFVLWALDVLSEKKNDSFDSQVVWTGNFS